MEIDALVFQGAPEAFDEDIVHLPPPTIHADADISASVSSVTGTGA